MDIYGYIFIIVYIGRQYVYTVVISYHDEPRGHPREKITV